MMYSCKNKKLCDEHRYKNNKITVANIILELDWGLEPGIKEN